MTTPPEFRWALSAHLMSLGVPMRKSEKIAKEVVERQTDVLPNRQSLYSMMIEAETEASL